MKKFIGKYRVLLVVEALLILLSLAGCLQKEKSVYSISGEEIGAALQENDDGIFYFQSEYLSLNSGVYQVRAAASIAEGDALVLNLSNDNETKNVVRCDAVLMFAGMEYVDFEAYVVDSVDTAYVRCEFYGSGQASLVSLELYRTGMGSRILAFLAVAAVLLLNLLLLFREKILSGEVDKRQQAAFWILAGSVLLAFFPYATDYMNEGKDTIFHLLRIEGLKETLMQGGQFPVRVQSYWLYDHGYAVSSFYGDLFLLIPATLRMIGFSMMNSYKIFVFAIMAATAAIAYYSFKGCTGNSNAALFGSVLYMLAPYRIYLFYNRGAVGEYLAMAFFPLICYGIYRIYREDIHSETYGKAKIPVIIGLTCILQSHIKSAAMTGIFILFACLLMWKKTFRKKTFLQLAESAGITLLLNCWFWLPLLRMLGADRYVWQELPNGDIQSKGTQLAGVLQLFPEMGGIRTGMFNSAPVQIGAAALLLLCLFGLLGLMRYRRKEEKGYFRILFFLFVMIVVIWFMSTQYFPWDLLTRLPGIGAIVKVLPYPADFMAPASVLCATFAAFFYCWVQEEGSRRLSRGSLLFVSLIALFSAIYQVNDIAFRMEPVRVYTAENLGTTSFLTGAEFLPAGTSPEQFHYHGPVADEELQWRDYDKKGVQIDLHVNNTSDREAFIELPVTGYKGYNLKCEGTDEEQPYITEERGNHGDLRIAVPAGYEGSVLVRYGSIPVNRAAEVVSLVTVIGMMGYGVLRRRKNGLHE